MLPACAVVQTYNLRKKCSATPRNARVATPTQAPARHCTCTAPPGRQHLGYHRAELDEQWGRCHQPTRTRSARIPLVLTDTAGHGARCWWPSAGATTHCR